MNDQNSDGQTTLRSRRDLLRMSVPAVIGGIATPVIAGAQSPLTPLTPLNRFPRMMQDFVVPRVRDNELTGLKRKQELRTKADAEAYVREVRTKIRACFGPLPGKTPLNPRVTATLDRDTYRLEKVIFDSRPGFPVTGNLYIPKNRNAPSPGVISPCGHYDNAKAHEYYQSYAQGLARMGYVVLIYDPIGQGERLQYADAQLRSPVGAGVLEHLYAGNQQMLTGEVFATWRAWDGIRALDYLLTRPEVDPRHVGVTGNSGGGTVTTWLCALDDRWTMAAPDCFVTTFRRNLENEMPQDIEQYVPRVLSMGLDQDDFIAVMAPRPVILISQEKDFFDVRGTEEAYQRLRHLYKLLGAEQNIAMFTGPSYHGYTRENREAMYRWFNRATGVSTVRTEPAITLEKDETLWCTPRGQVADLKPRTVFSFTREQSQAQARRRGAVGGETLKKAVVETLKLPLVSDPPDANILNRVGGRRYPKPEFANYAVITEPGVSALVYRLSDDRLYSRPPRGQHRAILYVSDLSSDVELREEPLLRELIAAEPGAAFFTCDVRGVGESLPDTCGDNHFFLPYGNDYFYAGHSLMLGRPYVGQKTFDILRVLDWLKTYDHTDIHLVAKGRGAIPATFAALLADTVTQVTLKHALASYTAVAESERYDLPLSCIAPGILQSFDLPDCYRELAAKKLRQIDPRGALEK
ncbi:MAG: alpha/beta hydrolase family protein [Blastocatellia bacterium]